MGIPPHPKTNPLESYDLVGNWAMRSPMTFGVHTGSETVNASDNGVSGH